MKLKLNTITPIATLVLLVVIIILQFLKPSGKDSTPTRSELSKEMIQEIDSTLKVISSRPPIEKQIIIIDNETAKNLNALDTMSRESINNLFSRFDSIKRLP